MGILEGPRAHAILFSIQSSDRAEVSKWLQDVRTFFATTAAQAADTSKAFSISPLKGPPGSSVPPSAVTFSGNFNNSGPAATTTNAVLPISLGHQSFTAIEDALEGVTVHHVVQLTSILGHFLENIRIEAARLLFGIAAIFDKKAVDWSKKMEKVVVGFRIDDRGYYSAVHDLFHYIGPSLSLMAVALVAGLECFYTCPDWTVRGICNTALARIVYECDKIFLEEDQLAAIWNLFFSLHSIPLFSKVFPDRIVIIKALGLLTPLYAPADTALTYRIIESLLRLHNKTALETEAIKSTLRAIFEKLAEKAPPAGQQQQQQQQINSTSISLKAIGTKDATGLSGPEYALFVTLINPHDEYAYDLLSWALESYSASLLPMPPGTAAAKQKKFPVTSFPLLAEFVKSLSNHFRATPALVRYGACVSFHTALTIFPTLMAAYPELSVHVITGALDTDYLSAFLYIAMLESLHGSDTIQIKTLLGKLRHQEYVLGDYDTYFVRAMEHRPKTAGMETETRLGDVLDLAMKASPPVGGKILQKWANSLEYLSKTMQLRQLELIRLWGGKAETFDTFLMQTLVPYCNSTDEDIQMAALRVISALTPSFRNASAADISFAWSYLHALMEYKTKASTLQAVLTLMNSFPLEKLAEDAREDLLSTLFRLIFHQDPNVRLMVYNIIGQYTDFWKASNLFTNAFGIMFLAIGDHNVQCARKVCEYLLQMSNSSFRSIITPLGAVKDALQSGPAQLLKAYDELANCILKERAELPELIAAVTMDATGDEFWGFFLEDAPENQLVRPDDYNYARNFVHAPFWVALLLTKLGAPPPALGEGVPRNVMPTTPAGKRRFICGFMLCLLPTCGMPDPVMRRTACTAIVRCCFRNQTLHPGLMRGLLEFVSQQMMAHKQWTFQLSALDILKNVTRLKLPGVSSSILLQYIDLALDVAYNTPSSIVKSGALELIESFLLVFPHGVGYKLQEIRDVIRALLVDTDMDVVHNASRIFPLVFRCVPPTQSSEFISYLRAEIATITHGGHGASADPMISNLSAEESDRVVRLSIKALGAINDRSTAYGIVQELLPFLQRRQWALRAAALSSALAQLANLDGMQSTIILWSLLPTYGDPSQAVRLIFSRFLRRVPSKLDALCKALPPHPDDNLVLPHTSWEDILNDNALINVNGKNMNDILFPLELLSGQNDPNVLPREDDGFRLPTVSTRLMARFKELVRTITGPVTSTNVGEVMYYLQELQRVNHLQGPAMLVLSEFCCLHDSTLAEVIDILTNDLGQEITPDNATMIEACMLGLRNISEHSPSAFKQILVKISSLGVISEGDLMAMFYLSDLIQDINANKAPELLRRYLPIITSQRHAMRKRLLAVYLNVELALIAGQEEMGRVLDAIQVLLDTTDDAETRQKIYGCLGKILGHLGPKHSLFRNLLSNAKKEIKSKHAEVRLRSLNVIRILSRFISIEEAVWFCLLYLADSSREVRNTSRELLVMEGLLDFVMPALRTHKVTPGSRRTTILESCKLPSIDKLSNSLHISESEQGVRVPFPDEDPYNVRYYNSDRRRKFTQHYGLREDIFDKAVDPPPLSIMAMVEEKSASAKRPSSEMQTKYQWLLNIDSITILRECIKKYPQVASDLVEATLRKVEEEVTPREKSQEDRAGAGTGSGINSEEENDIASNEEEDEVDIEAEIHLIDVLSNLLFAHDGIGDKVPGWLDRVQRFIAFCNNNAKGIRESLYTNLESSFFFFNEYIDIPIVSDEQYEALEAFKAATQEATLEIVKSGKTDKFSALEMRKNDLNDLVDTRLEQLRRLTVIALHGISGYGLFHALSTALSESQIVAAFQLLADMLENEHRGIRIAAVESLVTIAMIQLEASIKPGFTNKIKTVVQNFLARLTDSNSSLYRRKVDMINVMTQLISYVKERPLRLQFIGLLVHLWKDADAEVRVGAIKMIQVLGEGGVTEVAECFQDKDDTSRSKEDTPHIMKALASLIHNPEYPEKDVLQDLLKWRFTQPIR
ncbi:armadillo-type protein [Phlyctochytrium arcticum]|nr:armadillo-type protein [Phlyctochytrium arcticum]